MYARWRRHNVLISLPRFLFVLILLGLLGGCGKPASVPADVRVLKEGTFTITPDKPLFAGAEIFKANEGDGWDWVVIEIKVTAGDAVEVASWQDSSENKEGTPLKPLTTTNPVKEIRLTGEVRHEKVNSRVRINLKTTGKSSDVSLKITQQYKGGK
jgi:hypothetical protein